MSDEAGTSAGGDVPSLPFSPDASPSMSIYEATAQYAKDLEPPKEPAAESAPAATAENELAQANPESPTTETAEGTTETEPAKPAIDPPKSWTKDLHEHWASLDPVLQERIVARDREDQAAIKRAFNEAAEQRKAIQVEREAAEKARQHYESQLPALMQELQSVQQNAFSDIKSMDDVVRLQAEDPYRFQAWQVQQMRLQAAKAETDRIESEKSGKQQSEWAAHINEQNARALELIPELADEAKSNTLRERVIKEVLPDLGFTSSELNELAAGKSKLSIYDARIQRLLADSLALRDIRNAPKAVAAKPLPPVQRPGSPRPSGAGANSERLQALNKQLASATGNQALRISAEIYQLENARRKG